MSINGLGKSVTMENRTVSMQKMAPLSIPLLSHMRWVAALVVVLSHVQQNLLAKSGYVAYSIPTSGMLVTKDLLRPGGFGHAAVVTFFVLSGFLVGGKLTELSRSPTLGQEWPQFLIDRFSRIFVVAWPALLLTLIVLFGLLWLVPNAPFVQDGNWAVDLADPLTYDAVASRWIAASALLNELVH